MKAHAVPQEIMSVEFKLFGNFMSLREFIYISIGIAISYFFYFLMNRGIIPGIIAWPIIVVVCGGGTIISLVPFQGRSLETWIMNYFVAIQRPTQRVWQKTGFDPLQTASGASIIRKDHVVTPPVKSSPQQIVATSTTSTTKNSLPIEKEESKRLREISTTIQHMEDRNPVDSAPNSQVQQSAQTSPPSKRVPVPAKTAAPGPPQTATPAQPVQPAPTSEPPQTAAPAQPVQPAPTSEPPQTAAPAQPVQQPAPTSEPPQTAAPAQPAQPAQPAPNTTVKLEVEEPAQPATQQQQTHPIPVTITDHNYKDFATEIPGVQPQKDTINIVVSDQADQLIPQVTCIIKDAGENPVRASVSNQLGQIINNVPLKKGTYKIQLSKQGFVFPVIIRVLSGKIYPPLKIKSL